MFWENNRNSNRRKVVNLTKRVKALFDLGYFTKPNDRQEQMMIDVGDMTLGLIEYLLRDTWTTEDQYIESINSFLDFESVTFDTVVFFFFFFLSKYIWLYCAMHNVNSYNF